jgi:prophage antirepressor-like protein
MNIYKSLDKNYIQYGKVKINVLIDNNDNFWFSGQDTAQALGYKENNRAEAVRTHVPKTDKLPFKKIDVYTKGIHGDTIYIDETGLYTFITASGMPIATKFVRWINSEVLPSIRKYGQYKLKQELENQQTELFKKINYLEKENTKLKNDLKKDIYPEGGVVYVIDHSVDGNELYRIGMSNNMTTRKKVHDTHTPHKLEAVIVKKTKNPIQLEMCVRFMLYDFRIKNRKDFYACSIGKIRYAFNKCIKEINSKTVQKINGGSKTKKVQKGGHVSFVTKQLHLLNRKNLQLQQKIKKLDHKLLEK